MNKTVYCIIVCCCFCIFMCKSKEENKKVSSSSMEKSLNLSLLFYPSRATKSVIYSIDIINDSLIIKTNWRAGNKEHRGKLTDEQYSEIEKMISALTQKYDRTGFYAYDVWGCTLEIDNQVYYEDNHFDLIPRSKENYPPPIPEEIKLLINYIVSLSPIPIVLFGFA